MRGIMRRPQRLIIAGGLLALVALLSAACSGDTRVNVAGPEQSGIAVTGTGTVTVVPDVALLNVGVEVTRSTVAVALAEANGAMDAVRSSLDNNGIEERDIRTQSFNIYAQYDFSRERQEIVGFTVSNQLSIKVREIDDTSEVLDDAIDAGGDAVRVNGISFTVDDPDAVLDQAREAAVEDARDRAETLAELSGVSLGDVRSISESRGGGISVDFDRAESADDGAGISISPGESELAVTVSVVYEIE